MFRYTKWSLVREILVILAALVMLSPFYILIVTALKPVEEVLTTGPLTPSPNATLDNFATIFSNEGNSSLVTGLVNSVIITAGTILLLIGFGSTASYVLSRRLGKLSTTLFLLAVAGIVVPAQLGLVPIYVAARNVGLVGNRWGMIVIYSMMLMPLAVFLYSGFCRGIPREYEEAATIDGASRWQVFARVVFPLLAPATGTVAIMTGLIVWNDFFTPLVFLDGTDQPTLPVVMYNYIGSLVSQWNYIFAVVLVSMVPILAFYLFAQKRFIQGFAGGIKS